MVKSAEARGLMADKSNEGVSSGIVKRSATHLNLNNKKWKKIELNANHNNLMRLNNLFPNFPNSLHAK